LIFLPALSSPACLLSFGLIQRQASSFGGGERGETYPLAIIEGGRMETNPVSGARQICPVLAGARELVLRCAVDDDRSYGAHERVRMMLGGKASSYMDTVDVSWPHDRRPLDRPRPSAEMPRLSCRHREHGNLVVKIRVVQAPYMAFSIKPIASCTLHSLVRSGQKLRSKCSI
jgi:hypothetical protein